MDHHTNYTFHRNHAIELAGEAAEIRLEQTHVIHFTQGDIEMLNEAQARRVEVLLQEAQVEATLALAAATMRIGDRT